MNHAWNDENLDQVLREAMHARPDLPPIDNLALRAVHRADNLTAPQRQSRWLRRCHSWQTVISVAAAVTVAMVVWLAADYVATGFGNGSSTNATALSDGSEFFQQMASQEAVLISLAVLAVSASAVVIHRTMSQEGPTLAAAGPGDWV